MPYQATLPGFGSGDGLLDEQTLRAAWRRLPGHGDDDCERFMQYPAVRQALTLTVMRQNKRRARRCPNPHNVKPRRR